MFSKAMFEYYEIFIIELGLLHLWPRTPLNALKIFQQDYMNSVKMAQTFHFKGHDPIIIL